MNKDAEENLQRLAMETGIPIERYRQWASAPAPAGMDPEMWRSALAHRVQHHRPWPEDKLQHLGRMAASTRKPASEEAAA